MRSWRLFLVRPNPYFFLAQGVSTIDRIRGRRLWPVAQVELENGGRGSKSVRPRRKGPGGLFERFEFAAPSPLRLRLVRVTQTGHEQTEMLRSDQNPLLAGGRSAGYLVVQERASKTRRCCWGRRTPLRKVGKRSKKGASVHAARSGLQGIHRLLRADSDAGLEWSGVPWDGSFESCFRRLRRLLLLLPFPLQ